MAPGHGVVTESESGQGRNTPQGEDHLRRREALNYGVVSFFCFFFQSWFFLLLLFCFFLKIIYLFFKKNYLFIYFWCVGSSFLCEGFL